MGIKKHFNVKKLNLSSNVESLTVFSKTLSIVPMLVRKTAASISSIKVKKTLPEHAKQNNF